MYLFFFLLVLGLLPYSPSFKPGAAPRGTGAKRRRLSLSSVGGGYDLHGELAALQVLGTYFYPYFRHTPRRGLRGLRDLRFLLS